ncbi:MAG: hypothetical protein ACK570_10760, partial [Bacteroidota bacterium]
SKLSFRVCPNTEVSEIINVNIVIVVVFIKSQLTPLYVLLCFTKYIQNRKLAKLPVAQSWLVLIKATAVNKIVFVVWWVIALRK